MLKRAKWWEITLFLFLSSIQGIGCGEDPSEEDDDDREIEAGDRNDDAVEIGIDLDGSLQNPAWSPASDALLFTRFVDAYNEGPADLYISDLDGDGIRELVSEGSDNVNLPGSSWSADQELIVFSSSREPHDEIYVIDDGGATGDEEQITLRDGYMAYEPSFSPNGDWVVFESHVVDQEDNGVITKYRVDGSGEFVELTDADDDCRQPNWSPSGDRIVYQRFDGDEWNLWTMNDDGSNPAQITEGPGDKTDASFSPDGEWIVYSSDEGELDLANLFVIPAAGGDSIRVTEWGGYDGAPSWSPDGERIAFESFPGDPDDSEGTSLWMIDAPTL